MNIDDFKINNSNAWYLIPILAISIFIVLFGIGYSLYWVFQGLFAGVGIAIGFIVTGISASPIVIYIGSLGFAVGGSTYFYREFKRVTGKSYGWIIPILALISGFVIEITKELFPGEPMIKHIIGFITGMAFLIAGTLWIKRKWYYRLLSIILYLFPPLFVLLNFTTAEMKDNPSFILEIINEHWLTIVLLIGIIAINILVLYLFQRSEKQ